MTKEKYFILVQKMLGTKTDHFKDHIENPFMCHRIITDGQNSDYTDHRIESYRNERWVLHMIGGGSMGGLKYIPLPGYPKYHQSGRMLNAIFCGLPSRFPDSGLVFQKGIRKIGRDYEIVETLKSLEISLNESKITNTSYVSPSLPKQIPINYILVTIFGGICVGFICLSLICLIGFLIIRQKRKETFNGRPSFSLESIDESAIQEYQSQLISSSKQNLSNVESVQNDCGYTKLIQTEFECSSEKIISIQSFENQNIIQFLTQKFETLNPIKGPKSADKLLEEAFEEPLIEDRAIKLLQIVIKANNELYLLGYRNQLVNSAAKFHLTTPSASEQWLNSLKEGEFLRFIVSICEKEIDGKNGEFEENLQLWKMYLEKCDIFECFRHACFFGQSLKRRQFFILGTFYKMALLLSQNSNRNSLLSMNFPIPIFVNLCEKFPHYFEIH
uniref:Uncharacterized protein n=1 Tax=Panagrolaimus sp. PS1159 TaxID=55785 RepID=A0AC35FKI7_9BILA